MPRMTRAKAADLADALHIDEDATLECSGRTEGGSSTPIKTDRPILGELAPNSGGSQEEDGEVEEFKKSTKGRKTSKKGAKGKKNNFAASTTTRPKTEVDTEAGGDAADDSCCRQNGTNEDVQENRSKRGLRDRRAKEHDADDVSASVIVEMADPERTSLHQEELLPASGLHAPASPLPFAIPNVVEALRKDSSSKRSASNKENIEPMALRSPATASRPTSSYDALEEAAVQAATPPTISRRASAAQPSFVPNDETHASSPSPQRADPIADMDALEDAVEQITAQLPGVQESPKKSSEKVAARPKKAVPVVRTTKASQARISLAHPDRKAAKPEGRSRQSSVLLKSRDVSGERFTPAGNKKPDTNVTLEQQGEKKEAVIPHSKPRPVSLSFPTPPPPTKSHKAPTTSNFQLPGEAVAAKLRAAREARLAKEAEEAQKKKDATGLTEQRKPSFKARAVPATLSRAPSVRQTNASKARENLMNGKATTITAGAGTHKRANSVATTRLATAPKPRVISKDASTASTASSQQLKVAKRPSTAMATIGKPRSSMATIATNPVSSQRVPSRGTTKGKEVFNRAALAKEAAEKEKREKEEAAKRARAQAAERGRQASREWAEKQKLKKIGSKQPPAETKTSGEMPSGVEAAAAVA